MKRSLPLLILSLISAGSLGAAAYFWNAQRTLASENATLRARFLTTPDSGPAAPPKLTSSGPKEEATPPDGREPGSPSQTAQTEEEKRREEFRARMESMREKESLARQQAKITLLKSRLKLTPEQETAAAAALQKARDLRRQARENFRPGQQPDFKEMQKMFRSEITAREEINALLTPEQQQEYATVIQEEKTERAEEQSNRQLSEWQQYLKMDDAQKDAVFAILSQQAMQNDPEAQPEASSFDEVRERMESAQEAMRAELATVLDEAQLATYDELNTARRETFQGMGPGGPPPGGPPR